MVTNSLIYFDPDFGSPKWIPEAPSVFKISVFAKPKKWHFLLLYPRRINYEDEDALTEVFLLCERFIPGKDKFELRDFGPDELKCYSREVPVLSYNPITKSEYFWLCPPAHLRH